MAILPVLEIPNPILLQKAEPVETVTDEIKQLLSDMLETMYATHGVGLAGNQIGVLKRVVVLDCADRDDEPDPIKMVNPKIIWKSEEMICHNEGCLSIPRQYADVTRHAKVEVEYTDENGQIKRRRTGGLLAIGIQHELDHLEGILFIDYVSPLKRKMMLKRLEKNRKRAAEAAALEDK
jgi:peptide deformylase